MKTFIVVRESGASNTIVAASWSVSDNGTLIFANEDGSNKIAIASGQWVLVGESGIIESK